METTKSKTVFIEYSSARPGQHFMTVVQTVDHERITIGRIYRDYDPKNKKITYRAYDFSGNRIFGESPSVSDLKEKFKKNGKFLGSVVLGMHQARNQENLKPYPSHTTQRNTDIRTIRDRKPNQEREKPKEFTQTKGVDKTKGLITEKEKENGNQLKNKGLGNIIEEEEALHQEKERADKASELESLNNVEQINQDEKSEREIELEEIRAENEEREQDLEIDF